MANIKKHFLRPLLLLAAFVLWTWAVCVVDLQPIGPRGTRVGFGTLNGWIHSLTGVHLWLYELTDWLGLVPILVCAAFGMLGLVQWVRRRSLGRVDRELLEDCRQFVENTDYIQFGEVANFVDIMSAAQGIPHLDLSRYPSVQRWKEERKA